MCGCTGQYDCVSGVCEGYVWVDVLKCGVCIIVVCGSGMCGWYTGQCVECECDMWRGVWVGVLGSVRNV